MHNQPREPQPYEDCQAKSIQEFGWTSQGMDWGWGQGIKSHHTQTCQGIWLQLSSETSYLDVSSSFQMRASFVFHLETNVTAPVYQEILEHFMLPSADQLFKDADFIFQQDLAPAHTAKSTKSWLNDHGVGVLDWPANSPDLNHIENLWIFTIWVELLK